LKYSKTKIMMSNHILCCVSFAVTCLVPCTRAFVARTPLAHAHLDTFRSNPATILNAAAAAQDEELLHRALLARRVAGDGNMSLNKAEASGSESSAGGNRKGDDATAYVGNLPYSATEEQIRELFEVYGTVNRIYLPTEKSTGNFRGFGFVTLGSRDEMLAATKGLDQSSFLGRIIYSNESVPKEKPLRKKGPGEYNAMMERYI
jgi:hypothetical protein